MKDDVFSRMKLIGPTCAITLKLDFLDIGKENETKLVYLNNIQ